MEYNISNKPPIFYFADLFKNIQHIEEYDVYTYVDQNSLLLLLLLNNVLLIYTVHKRKAGYDLKLFFSNPFHKRERERERERVCVSVIFKEKWTKKGKKNSDDMTYYSKGSSIRASH